MEQAPGRTCGPMERGAHTGAGFLAGGPTQWSSQFLKDCSLWEGPTLVKFVRGCLLWGRHHAGAEEESEEERAAETTCDELTPTLFPIPLHHSGE